MTFMQPTTADIEAVETPFPFVEWTSVVKCYFPGNDATRSRYRSMRERWGISSQGVQFHTRSGGHLQGTGVVHSSLVILAIHAEQAGDHRTCAALLTRATDLEERFGPTVAAYLESAELSELHEAVFYKDLVAATSRALRQVSGWRKHLFVQGLVEGFSDTLAHVVGTRADGLEAFVDLPKALLESWDLETGDSVLVFQRMLSQAAVTQVLPGASTAIDAYGLGPADPAFARSQTIRDDDGSDARLRAIAAEAEPRRHLRPAG